VQLSILALMLWETISSADYLDVMLSPHRVLMQSPNPKRTSPVAPLSSFLDPPNAVIIAKNAVITAKLLTIGKSGPEQVQQGLFTEFA
jgi:hypothetical protein